MNMNKVRKSRVKEPAACGVAEAKVQKTRREMVSLQML